MPRRTFTRTASVLLAVSALIGIGSIAARAQDSGLDGYRYRLGVGLSPQVGNDDDHYSDLSPSESSSEFLAADYTFFRPTRHEALATLWYVHGGYNIDGESGTATFGAATAEYRWRFFGHGITYVAVGAGLSSGDFETSGIKFATTFGLGVDLGHFYISDRVLGFTSYTGTVGAVFFGVRF